jgi:hypothetical protein
MPETMRLLKCPACGGPLDPPAGESTMKCPYCNNAVIIPESLRLPKQSASSPQMSIFSGIDMNAMVGYGTHWAEVVRLAQSGNKADAIKKYMALTGNDESSASYMVNTLAGYQSYEFTPGSYNSVQQVYAPIMQQTNETIRSVTKWSLWLSLGITAFVICIILVTMLPILIGVFASLIPLFK